MLSLTEPGPLERALELQSVPTPELERRLAEMREKLDLPERRARRPKTREAKALASLTPRERLRLELQDRYGDMAAKLEEALAEGNGERAVRLYWDLVDQAYGKTAQ